MLHAVGALAWQGCTFESRVFFDRELRIFGVKRTQLTWDSAVAPARAARGPGAVILYVVLSGEMTHRPSGLVIRGGGAFLSTEGLADGIAGRRTHTVRALGEPFRSVELRVAPSLCRCAVPRAPEAWSGSTRIAAAADTLLQPELPEPAHAVRRYLGLLVDAGLLHARARELVTEEEPKDIARVWRAVSRFYLQLNVSPSLTELASEAGVSLRQMTRDVATMVQTFPVGGDGLREYSKEVRLRWAVTLLSRLSVTEVARAAG